LIQPGARDVQLVLVQQTRVQLVPPLLWLAKQSFQLVPLEPLIGLRALPPVSPQSLRPTAKKERERNGHRHADTNSDEV
jgi:hypothetical protein